MKNLLLSLFSLFCIVSCQPATSSSNKTIKLTKEFRDYWYSGLAEISSYKIKQNRYGEIRDGHTVHIFVTENLNNKTHIKTDQNIAGKTSVLKLNKAKKFLTGIYPYSVMTSTFSPLQGLIDSHALKNSFSSQEWCGHVYAQINNYNKDSFEIQSHSYFEGEGDQSFKINSAYLEDELLLKLRKNPMSLPTGNLSMIPSLEFSRLRHYPFKAVQATASLDLKSGVYKIKYKTINREIVIHFSNVFPYMIESWKITYNSQIEVEAKILKTIRTPYWNKNRKIDELLRKELLID